VTALYQWSEYHSRDDGHYSDWFQVDDEATVEPINATWDGFQIERSYHAPAILASKGTCRLQNAG